MCYKCFARSLVLLKVLQVSVSGPNAIVIAIDFANTIIIRQKVLNEDSQVDLATLDTRKLQTICQPKNLILRYNLMTGLPSHFNEIRDTSSGDRQL
jgi:hypothetical protein